MASALQPSDPHLASFPRPKDDNGRGLHFVLDSRQNLVEHYAPFLAKMKIKWAVVYVGDEQQATRVAKYLLDNFGIYSNMRVQATGDHPKPPSFWSAFAALAVKLNIPPYIQVFNEPEDPRENFDSPQQFADLWMPRAEAVAQAGGYPGLQVISPEFFNAVVPHVSDTVKQKMYFSLHNYGANHPPSYPYPAKTVLQDDTAVLRFLEYAEWFRQAWGFVPPMLGGEGGWLYQNHDDNTMPPVLIDSWVDWHYEMFEWFRSGLLSNGDPLPDYLFSVCPWLIFASNWYSDSWLDGLDADKKQRLIDKLAGDPPFVRMFGGAAQPQPGPADKPTDTGGQTESGESGKSAGGTNMDTPSTTTAEAQIDPRCKWVTVKQGTQYRVADVWFYDNKPPDDPESENNINIYGVVQSLAGRALNHEQVILEWPDGSAVHYTRNGMTSHQQSGDSNFDPNKGMSGPYVLRVGDASVSGLGLPLRQHVEYLIVFVKQSPEL